MSVVAPSVALVLGSVTPPQTDIVSLKVHVGATKEVSSFELTLQNWNAKYSPGGTYPISVGVNGSISLGRGGTCPLLMTCKVERVNCQSTAMENYIIISGRCWGEKLFRYIVTKQYLAQKGEAIVKDLIDYYAGLSHTRGATELVENTDTTYTKLEYENTPVFDILQYLAETADLAGVIGYDFRVAPDAKLEWFARGSKTNSTSLSEKIEQSEYQKDIFRVRNRITIYGAPEKSNVADKFSSVESLTPTEGAWTATAGAVSLDNAKHYSEGTASIKNSTGANYYGGSLFTFGTSYVVDATRFPILLLALARDTTLPGDFSIILYDTSDRAAQCQLSQIGDNQWVAEQLNVGVAYADQWAVETGFDWTHIWRVAVIGWCTGTTPGNFWVGQLVFTGCRYSSMQENTTSQSAYGLRMFADTDEELYSDNECELRAKAILANLKDSAESLTIRSSVIDYGSTPLLAGDKITIVLPNENVNGAFRIITAEYDVDANAQNLDITLELGRESPLLADYIYALRSKVDHVSRHKIPRIL